MKKTLSDSFNAARRVSVPLVRITTPDQFATLRAVASQYRESKDCPVFSWDVMNGITPQNAAATAAAKTIGLKPVDTVSFTEALTVAHALPQTSVLVALNAHRQFTSQEPQSTAAAVQAIANLRDRYKQNYRMLVLLDGGAPLPRELTHDVISLEEELPGEDVLALTVKEVANSAAAELPPEGRRNMLKATADVTSRAVAALSGLSAFEAEQVAAMSLVEGGYDLDTMWERKRVTIEQERGMAVWRGTERFKDLVGLDALKRHLTNRMKSRTPIGVVVWIDEIDKVLANVEGDTSGVRMDQLRTLLAEMENNDWRGLVTVGPPGGGKSAIAKAFGNEAGVPTIALDLGGMEGSLVGESEQHLRAAMRVIKAVGRGNAYFIATSNNATVMRPELQRRFTDGMWFVDVMGEAEREAAVTYFSEKYELTKAQLAKRPSLDGWSGAEIRNLCRYAWDTGCTLQEAAVFIMPMARSRAPEIEELRKYAHGKFLDANRPGPYSYDGGKAMATHVRAIRLPKDAAMVSTLGEA